MSNESRFRLARDFDECHGNEQASRVCSGKGSCLWKKRRNCWIRKEIQMEDRIRLSYFYGKEADYIIWRVICSSRKIIL